MGLKPASNIPKARRATMRPGKLNNKDYIAEVHLAKDTRSMEVQLTMSVDDRPHPIATKPIHKRGEYNLERMRAGI